MSNLPWNTNSSRRLLWVAIAALGALALLLAVTGQELYSQGEQVTEIGSSSYQFVGRIDQEGLDFTAYGYLYDIDGVAPADLFSDSDAVNGSESTAHFTYYATAEMTSRAVITDTDRAIFPLNSVGEITYYYNDSPSASFADPQSFTQGTAVTTATIRMQDILTVMAPNRGLAVGNGELSVSSADSFMFDGEMVQLGRVNKSYRIATTGDAIRTDPVTPESSVLLAGDASSTPFWQSFLPVMDN